MLKNVILAVAAAFALSIAPAAAQELQFSGSGELNGALVHNAGSGEVSGMNYTNAQSTGANYALAGSFQAAGASTTSTTQVLGADTVGTVSNDGYVLNLSGAMTSGMDATAVGEGIGSMEAAGSYEIDALSVNALADIEIGYTP